MHHPISASSHLLYAAGLLLLTAGTALAQPRHLDATGTSLAIDGLCARSVTIQPDQSLSGKYTVVATADHPEELAQLAFDGGPTAKLHGPEHECWAQSDRSFARTLDIAIRVPAHAAMAIDESGGTKYTVGNVGGSLALDISGGVTLQAASATNVTIDLSGGGSVAIGQVDGSVEADVSGGGDIRIDHGTLPNLELSLSGAGKFALGQGAVKTMPAEVSGGGTVTIGATVGDATIDVSGAGHVQLAKVTGALTKDVDGNGTVTVGAAP
jgi:hypothetical protein